MNELQQWQHEVRVKHAEARLRPPALDNPRPIQLQPNRLQPTPPHPRKLLRVQTDYFTAGALWEKIGGLWSCTRAAPILHWMKGRSPSQSAAALEKMGAHYQFLPDPAIKGSSHGAL